MLLCLVSFSCFCHLSISFCLQLFWRESDLDVYQWCNIHACKNLEFFSISDHKGITKNPRASVFYQQYCKHGGLWLVHTWLTVCYWLVMFAFYARHLIFSIIEHFCLDCSIVKTPIFVMRKWGEMIDQSSFMRKPLLKWRKNICIIPDSILQNGIIKTAIYKIKTI